MRIGSSVIALGSVLLVGREAYAQQACTAPKTFCEGHGGYYASGEDRDRVTAVTDPLLRELRACLDASGAKQAAPAFVIRWDSEGKAVEVKPDIPGYDSLPCVQKVIAKLRNLQNPHETAIRCEYGCPKPPPPKPAPPPVVAPPPVQQQPQQPTQGPAVPYVVAAPVGPAQPPPPQLEKRWYSWNTLVADGVSLGLFVGGVGTKTEGLTTVGYMGFLLGTPIVHWAHGNVGRGFGSMGFRILLPVLGMGIGAIAGLASAGGNNNGNGNIDHLFDKPTPALTGAVVGWLFGAGGCIAIDAAAFAYTKEPVEERGITRSARPWLALSPTLDVRPDRAAVGLGGRF